MEPYSFPTAHLQCRSEIRRVDADRRRGYPRDELFLAWRQGKAKNAFTLINLASTQGRYGKGGGLSGAAQERGILRFASRQRENREGCRCQSCTFDQRSTGDE